MKDLIVIFELKTEEEKNVSLMFRLVAVLAALVRMENLMGEGSLLGGGAAAKKALTADNGEASMQKAEAKRTKVEETCSYHN